MEAVELRKDAVAVVLGACGLRLRVCDNIGSHTVAPVRNQVTGSPPCVEERDDVVYWYSIQ